MNDTEHGSEKLAGTRRWWLIGAGAAVIAVVVAVAIANASTGTPTAGPTATSTSPTASNTTTSSPGPSSAAPSSAVPSPAPSASDAPAPGDESPEPVAPRETKTPVPLDQPAQPADGVHVSLTSIKAITGQAAVPGEIDGPALQVIVKVENTSKSDALTDTLIVNVYYGADRTPANILVSPRTDLPSPIAAGKSAEGVYAFTVPENARDHVVVEVDLSVDLPIVLFEGPVA